MAFQQGLSGLNSSSSAIDAISNNIANAGTVGFKSGQAHFADVYAASLQGTGAGQVGIGVNASSVFQQFSQGNITTTNNALDVSINGQGFYRMSDGGGITYTRNGQFHIAADGRIVNDTGLGLTGFQADAAGNIVPSAPGDLVINTSDLAPQATGTGLGVQANINLDSREPLPASRPWDPAVSASGVLLASPDEFNFSTALSVFDTLGNPHSLTMYFVKQDPAALVPPDPIVAADPAIKGVWDVYMSMDGADPVFTQSPTGAIDPVTGEYRTARLYFDGFGQLATNALGVTYTPKLALSTDLDAIAAAQSTVANPITNAAEQILAFDFDFTGSTQFGSVAGTNSLVQDGFSSGRLAGVSVGADGVIQGRYTNGQTLDMGQVVLANFRNPNGLQPLGGNQWAETAESGGPLVGAPDSASLGVLQSSSVEESNVDMTNELVAMITQQRNYQANAQTIKTQDQIMNTIVNLR